MQGDTNAAAARFSTDGNETATRVAALACSLTYSDEHQNYGTTSRLITSGQHTATLGANDGGVVARNASNQAQAEAGVAAWRFPPDGSDTTRRRRHTFRRNSCVGAFTYRRGNDDGARSKRRQRGDETQERQVAMRSGCCSDALSNRCQRYRDAAGACSARYGDTFSNSTSAATCYPTDANDRTNRTTVVAAFAQTWVSADGRDAQDTRTQQLRRQPSDFGARQVLHSRRGAHYSGRRGFAGDPKPEREEGEKHAIGQGHIFVAPERRTLDSIDFDRHKAPRARQGACYAISGSPRTSRQSHKHTRHAKACWVETALTQHHGLGDLSKGGLGT